ncbi:PLP-dependent transferase [Boletus edulis BED1]|uniref:PLP-dependent transferase n=1 Tax=Boletus edulis BED1 TaxID=1328754 RepID=A0AAD4BXK3_BOLED|nr:PLP-dependent transferase [Boletus edulis BED1]
MSIPCASSSLAFRLSRTVLTTIQPPIPQAKAWGSAYPSTPARPLLDMSQGAPGNPPPKVLLDALAKTSSSPQSTGYGHALGEHKLRAALAQEMKTVYGQHADITSNDVAITAGCNMSFIAAVMCLAEAGDEVILPVPWYFNQAMSLNLLGIKSVPLRTRSDQGFLPSPDECKRLITSKTKAITLVTPNNPTGAIYSPALIAQFAELARENNIALILDETYRDFVEHSPPHNLFSRMQREVLPPSWSWRSNIVHLFSFSKSYAIPGHRLGAVVASPELLQHITTTLDCIQVCAPRPPQLALANASLLSELRSSIQSNAKALKARHELFRKSLPSEWTIGSQGAFYAYVKHPFENVSSTTFCERLAKELGVLVLPAQFFYDEEDKQVLGLSEEGWDRWLRFSVANVGDEEIIKVCERLKEWKVHFTVS